MMNWLVLFGLSRSIWGWVWLLFLTFTTSTAMRWQQSAKFKTLSAWLSCSRNTLIKGTWKRLWNIPRAFFCRLNAPLRHNFKHVFPRLLFNRSCNC
jgi:hypothetical protein